VGVQPDQVEVDAAELEAIRHAEGRHAVAGKHPQLPRPRSGTY
jgi:hypothetical protein